MVSFPRRLVASTVLLATGLTALPAMATSTQQALVDRATLAVQDIFQGTTPNSRAQRYLAKRAPSWCALRSFACRSSSGALAVAAFCSRVMRVARGPTRLSTRSALPRWDSSLASKARS